MVDNRLYFVFGLKYSSIKESERLPVIGFYDFLTNSFRIDYSGNTTKEVYDKFVNNEVYLPVVTLSGVEKLKYSEILAKRYVSRNCFSVVDLDYVLRDEEGLGYLKVQRNDSLTISISLEKGLVWYPRWTRVAESKVWFRLEKFLWKYEVAIEIQPEKGLEVREVEG